MPCLEWLLLRSQNLRAFKRVGVQHVGRSPSNSETYSTVVSYKILSLKLTLSLHMKRGVFVFPTINLQVQVQVIWVLSITSAWWTKSLQKREIFNGHRQLLLVDGWNPPDHLGYVLYICIYTMYIYIYNLVSNGIIYLSNWCRTSSINSYQYTRVAPSTFKWFSTYVPSDIWLAWDLCFLEFVRLTKKNSEKNRSFDKSCT